MTRDEIAMAMMQQGQQRKRPPGGLAMLAPLPPLGATPQAMAQQVPMVGTPPRPPVATAPAPVNLFDQAYAVAAPREDEKGPDYIAQMIKKYFAKPDGSGGAAP